MPVLILSSLNKLKSLLMLALPLMALFYLFAGNGAALTDITAVTAILLLSTDSEAGQLSYNANDDIWTLTAGDTNTVFFEQTQISSNVGITVNGVVSANAFVGNGAALTDITAVTAKILSTDSEAGQLSYNNNDDIWI